MKNALKVLILASTILPGLAASAQAGWERLLTCDGGKAYLEVNTEERRNLQFVITEPGITKYLAENTFLRPVEDNAGVMVISGYVSRGVFSPSEFSGFTYSTGDVNTVSKAHVDLENNGLYVWANAENQYPGDSPQYNYTGNWHFRNCR